MFSGPSGKTPPVLSRTLPRTWHLFLQHLSDPNCKCYEENTNALGAMDPQGQEPVTKIVWPTNAVRKQYIL